ncbi:NAD(P)-binding protein, partial [Mycobacterium marinum]|uniref:NAD(P)-binding protein n=1 Tax=Mycobacterium marinum TaxID=1781 RepID=UPI002358C1E9
DAIVVGAGHNGLTAAAVLQRSGLRTLCMEANGGEPASASAAAVSRPARGAGKRWAVVRMGRSPFSF